MLAGSRSPDDDRPVQEPVDSVALPELERDVVDAYSRPDFEVQLVHVKDPGIGSFRTTSSALDPVILNP